MSKFSITYSISQSLKGLWKNRVMSTASILVLVSCMLVLGTFYALNVNINYNLEDLTLLNEVAAFVDEDCTDEEIEQIRQQIVALGELGLVNDVEYISKEQALEAEKDKFKDYPALFESLQEGDNPYRASFIITYKDRSKVSDFEYKLLEEVSITRQIPPTGEQSAPASETVYPISKVTSHIEIADTLENLKEGIRTVLLGFMAVLFVVAMFIVINTIRIAVFTRQNEISIMRYVGATNGYIIVPFIFEGIFMGIISGVIAFLIQWFVYNRAEAFISNGYRMFSVKEFSEIAPILVIFFLLIGLFAGIVGSLISLAKYLKEKD